MGTVQKETEVRDISEFTLPKYNEIPDVGLYLKQVVKYINETLGPWFDISVTETMISNYVKMHLVPNAIKKQYYRDQIAAFMFIVLSKTVVSLDNIQLLLKMREEKYEVKEGYELFSNAFVRIMRVTFGIAAEEDVEPADEVQALMKNIIIAIVQKYYIDRCFENLKIGKNESEE